MAMKIVRDDLWLCVDCTIWACNGDASGIEGDDRVRAVQDGVAELGPHLVPDFDSEAEEGIRDFSSCGCDACGSPLAGQMTRFAVLGPVIKWPSLRDVARELTRINREVETEDREGDGDGVDVRLNVRDDGTWSVLWGLSDYDQDHRGYWGASSVPGNRRRFRSRDVARELLDQAKEYATE